MEWVRRWAAQARLQLRELTVSQQLLIGMCAIFIAVVIGVVVLYASSPATQVLLDQPLSDSERARITTYLSTHGIEYEVTGDRVYVPPSRYYDALAGLQMQQLLPADTSTGFDSLIESQTWWHSSEQNRQLLNNARMGLLAKVLRAMPWVQDATVIIDLPTEVGFGRTVQRPSAAANIVPAPEARFDRAKIDAVAALVAGAVAGMDRADVTVIDAVAGRQYRSDDDDTFITGEALELLQHHERRYRQRLFDALRYIPNVIVAVNIEIDPTRKQIESERFDRDNSVELLASENTSKTEERTAGSTGEPGVRANTGADISGAGGSVVTSSTDTSDSTFDTHAGRTHEVSQSPGGLPVRVHATVNVPRSYFVQIHRTNTGAAAADAPEPTDEVLAPLIQAHLDRIRLQVQPLVAALEAGQVVVDVYPDAAADLEIVSASAAGGIGALLGEGMMTQVGAIGLALVSIGALFWMVRRAAQHPPVPSARELAGLPPILEDEGPVMVGEAGEASETLQGLEIPETDLRHRQMVDQLSQVIRENPKDVARIARRVISRSA